MPTLKKFFPFILLTVVALIFYHKYFLFGLIPFPGDLLVAEYQPFRSYSYNGYVPGSVPNKAQYFDSIREFYPWQTFTTNELKNGRLPLWNPHDFSGAPHLGNFLTAVFYPFNVLYLIINQVHAWAILVFLQPLLASFFMYLYCKKIGIGTYGSLFGAAAFAYSSYMNTWLQFQVIGHTILWLPLILFCFESLIEKFSARTYVLLVVSILCTVFAGHPLDFLVVFIFSGFYALLRAWKEKATVKKSVLIISAFPIALLLGSIQLVPTLQLLAHSTRAPVDYQFLLENILIQPFQLIMFVIPDYFGNPATRNYWPTDSYVGHTLSVGVTSILFILLSWVSMDKLAKFRKYVIYFTVSIGVLLLLTTNTFISALIYKINVPVLSSIQPSKLLPIFAFCFSMLTAIGLDVYINTKKTQLGKILHILIVLLCLFSLSMIGLLYIPIESRTIAIKQVILSLGIASLGSIFFAGGLYLKNWKRYAAFALILLLLSEQYYAFQKFNPFSPKEFIFPEAPVLSYLQQNAGIDRYWGYGTARIESNIATQYGLYSPDGFGALNLKRYNEFVRTSKDGQIPESFNQVTRSVAEIEPGYGETDLPNNQFRLRVLDTLGVKYILDRVENPKDNGTFPTSRFKLVWEDEYGWKIYENLLSAPRFFLTNKVYIYSSKEEFENKFFAADFDPKTMVLVENGYQQPTFCTDEKIKTSSVTLEKYEPTHVVFNVKTSCPVFLFLSDTFDSNWKATVGTNQTSIIKTNYALRGVEIPQGNHHIEFSYSLL